MFGPIESLLDPGERLLWSGQPLQGLRLQASDFYLIPFSIFWCAFVFVWEAMALGIGFSHPHPVQRGEALMAWIFPLWGIPFILVGLYLLFGRFFFDAASRQRTWYAITDRRLVILKSLFTTKINSYDYPTLINLNLVERGDRSGDILFGTPAYNGGFGGASWPQSRRMPVMPGFYLLPGAREVYNQIRAVQQQAKK